MIVLDHTTKLYGTVIGLNDLCLALAPGAYGLLGPNGSGKSTLLNLITGQLRPTLGSVRVFDRRPWNSREVRQRIGYCPEQDLLYPNVTALEWVGYLLELHGFGRREAQRRAVDALERVGLAAAMRRPVGGYSRGMRQRAKLAQAFAHEPELLILDEPFNGLDPIGRHEMTEFLRAWIRGGRSLLVASHILHEVEALTQSFLLIYGSRLLAAGSAQEVHALLTDVTNEIRIRASRPRELAARLAADETVDAVRIDRSQQTVVVSTRSPAELYRRLPGWIESAGLQIYELRSADESLQSLFTSLLQIRRGMR